MQVDLTPSQEARLSAAARQTGVAPAELVKRLIEEHLPYAPATDESGIDAILRQRQEQDGTALQPDIPTQSLFAQWAEEDARMTDEEREAEARFWEEFEKGINETRAALGMRLL